MGIRRAVYLLLLAKLSVAQTHVSLDLIQGTIKGVVDEYHNVELYRGVPFAQPPTGDLRWKPTVGLESFSDLGKGDDFQHITKCPQGYDLPDTINRYGEDCLLMNIYRLITHSWSIGYSRPLFRPTELSGPAPILVWIHGGGLQIGSGIDAYFNATYLAKDGAQIVINISYRLGILGGFLNDFNVSILNKSTCSLRHLVNTNFKTSVRIC